MHRRAHAVLLLSFLGLALTGLPLKYSDAEWAKSLAYHLGGFESTELLAPRFRPGHFRLLRHLHGPVGPSVPCPPPPGNALVAIVFGPDSPVPNWRNVKDFFKMIRWFVGLGPKPGLRRWAYWEKVDFWASAPTSSSLGPPAWLWFPTFFCGLPARRDLERRQGDPFHAGAAGHGLRVRHPLFQRSPAAGRSSPPTCRC